MNMNIKELKAKYNNLKSFFFSQLKNLEIIGNVDEVDVNKLRNVIMGLDSQYHHLLVTLDSIVITNNAIEKVDEIQQSEKNFRDYLAQKIDEIDDKIAKKVSETDAHNFVVAYNRLVNQDEENYNLSAFEEYRIQKNWGKFIKKHIDNPTKCFCVTQETYNINYSEYEKILDIVKTMGGEGVSRSGDSSYYLYIKESYIDEIIKQFGAKLNFRETTI